MANKIAVIGASSMVGSRYCELTANSTIQADLNGEIKIDITDKNSVANFFENYDFDLAVLFSAFTDVDGAQKQNGDKNGLCWKLNVDGVKNVAENAKSKNKKLIILSTDFVFDGKNGPYPEIQAADQDEKLIGWYGFTKRISEQIVMENLSNYVILRIAYPYRAKFETKTDFARNILTRYEQDTLYPFFDDQIITPLFVDDIGPALDLIIKKDLNGIIHLVSPLPVTPYDFACTLIEKSAKDVKKIEKTHLIDFLKSPHSTPRPIKGGLKTEKLPSHGFTPTDWKTGLDKLLEQMNKN